MGLPAKLTLIQPKYQTRGLSLHVEKEAGADDFTALALQLNANHEQLEHSRTAIQFHIGDFQLEAERLLGSEESWQVTADLAFQPETLANCRWVAKSIPPDMRRPALSWSIHREVAALPNVIDRELWLAKAEENHWTVKVLKVHLQEALGKGKKQKASVPIRHILLKKDGERVTLAVETKDGWRDLGAWTEITNHLFTAQDIEGDAG